jgi:hypothetical protein
MRQLSEMTVLWPASAGSAGDGQKLSALGATIIGTSRRGRPIEHVDRLIQVADIASTVPQVDAIVLTLPGTAATEKLIGTTSLPRSSRERSGERGTRHRIDEDIYCRRARRRTLGCPDVFATEPL